MENVIILDVEGMSGLKPYNIGYIVGDTVGNILKKVSVALPETLWENLQKCYSAKEMTHKNIKEILADYGKDDNKYDYLSIANFLNNLKEDIKIYGVNTIWAYNVVFDKNAIEKLYGDIAIENVEWCDIWSAVFYARCNNEDYVKFCLKNNFVTEKNNIKTSAETVYAYKSKDLTFCEEHTGLSDCCIEYELLLWALEKKEKIVKRHTTPAWRILDKIKKNIEWE